ncbi:MAG TPA: DUF2933 domain-containing protein [Propionicimonas sp.]|jgi:hypothetical protein
MKGHLKHMLIGGAAILAVLLVAGVDFRQALQWAVLLACPVMMMGMMVMMNRNGGSHGHDAGDSHCAGGDAKADAHGDLHAPVQKSRLN